MRRLARRPAACRPGCRAIDIVGTGGDASGSLNISTGTALLAAACGVPVVKHGNRSVSSRCGQRGRARGARPAAAAGRGSARRRLPDADRLHLPVRALLPPGNEGGRARCARALGVRTVFNILGPLANPASAAAAPGRCLQRSDGAPDGAGPLA